MFPTSYERPRAPPSNLVILEPAKMYELPGQGRKSQTAVVQILPGGPARAVTSYTSSPFAYLQLPQVVVVDEEELARKQMDFIYRCQYPLRKLPTEIIQEASLARACYLEDR